jgi:FAD/FMN-containing dehydrogenase
MSNAIFFWQCASLTSSFPSQVFPGKTGEFNLWDAKQSEHAPACRVEPLSAEDVSSILKIVTDAECHFAVKSGGHARSAGISNAAGGVTIDLKTMNSVSLSEDLSTVQVGAGAQWLDVYQATEPSGHVVLGGRVADVGVGGFTLGGGISFFSNRYGWACDSVLSYELVLPNSTVITVTANSHPSLSTSLRGAGQSQFGIVTSFIYPMVKLPNPAVLWEARRMYSWDKVPALLELHYDYYTVGIPNDPDVGGWNCFGYNPAYDMWFVMDEYVHTTHSDPDTFPPVYQKYADIEPIPDVPVSMGIKPYSNISFEIAVSSPAGGRNIYGTFCFKPDVALSQRILDILKEEIEVVRKLVPDLQPNVVYQPLSTNTMSLMTDNAVGLSAAGGPLVLVNIAWRWEQAANDTIVYETYYRFVERAEEAAKAVGMWHPFKYANYAEETQDLWAGYGAESVERLRKVQREVDPKGIFTRGGFAGKGWKVNERVVEKKTARKSEL